MICSAVAICLISSVSWSTAYLRWKNSSRSWTVGIASKLCAGGGFEVIHSRLRASHGSSGAFTAGFLLRCVITTFTMKQRIPIASTKAPTVEMAFQNRACTLDSSYRYMRRGWPWRPTICIGPKVRFMPMTISQKFALPQRSFRSRPKTFGHQ
uniref:Unannotated protein n=1 Tax=freshwater metagenome TaxID=449393 RepID=A0A6J7PZB9_9ZZZZ